MQMSKFVSYFENGIINIDYSKKFYPQQNDIPCHADICKKLRDKGIQSKDLITAGTLAYLKNGNPLIIDQRFLNAIDTEDIIAYIVESNKEYKDDKQILLDFGKEK